MTPATLAALLKFQAARDTMIELFPETAPADDRDCRTPLNIDAPTLDAIDDALDFLYAIDPGQPTADEPAALVHWRAEAWRAVVLATHTAAGQEIDAATLAGMTTAQLEQLAFMPDYDG